MIHMLIFVFAYSVFLTLLCGVKENKPTKLTSLCDNHGMGRTFSVLAFHLF